MGILKEIERIKYNRTFLIVFFDISFLILPGIAVIFLFHREIFLSIDWIKLILLSASITAPTTFLNTFLLLESEKVKMEDGEGFFFCFSRSIIITGFLLFLAAFSIYLTGGTLKTTLIVFAVVELSIVIEETYKARRNSRRKIENPPS